MAHPPDPPLGRNFWRTLELSATVYNLFGEDYGYPGFEEHVQDIIPADGLTYRFKLSYLF